MSKRIRLSIKLTEKEWAEVVAALHTKMYDIQNHRYPGNTEKWLKRVRRAHERIVVACNT